MEASLAMQGQAAPTGVTTFANEACEGVDVNEGFSFSPYARPQQDIQDLKVYFQRPRLFTRGAFSTGTRANVFNTIVNQSFLTTTFPQWANRLSGVYGVKFSLCFRLQVAATAFHQGLLTLNWQYAQEGNFALFVRNSNSAASTNLPHVRLDLSESTMVELKVPFIWAFEFWPVSGPNWGVVADRLGHIGLNAVLPIQSVAGLVAPTYEAYCWLEDMEFFGADDNAVTAITLQSGVIAKELRESKIISSTLGTGARVASFVATHVPSLAAVAGPTAWALDVAAGVAKYFGFSRPMVQDPVLRVFRSPYVGEANVDIPAAEFTLGLMQSNTLALDGVVGGTDVDEMSLKFVTSQFSQVCVGFVSTADTHNKAIYASIVSPNSLWFRAPTSAPYCNIRPPANSASLLTQSGCGFLPSSLMNIAQYFRLWRGTIVYRFTFAKTKFHGGRYMISFNPFSTVQASPNTSSTTVDGPEVVGGLVQPYGYTMICDLRDGNVFEFPVPYMQEVPWLSFYSGMGSISVVCIDPLQANSNVTTTVPFLVEAAGGDDFMLADFAGLIFPPAANLTIYTQSGSIAKNDALVKSATADPSQHTIGEMITSVKQMIQSPTYSVSTVATGATSSIYFSPWYGYSMTQNVANAGVTSPLSATLSYSGASYTAGALAKMYAYARGSSDIHIYPSAQNDNINWFIEQIPSELVAPGTIAPATSYALGRFNTAATPKVVSTGLIPIHTRAPAFQTCLRWNASNCDGTVWNRQFPNTGSTPAYQVGHLVRARVANNTGGVATFYVSQSAGDDATAACYIGPLPCVIPNALQTSDIYSDWIDT